MPRSFPLRITLTPRDRRTVSAIAEAMFTDDGALDEARAQAHVEAVDALLSAASKTARFAMRLALLAVSLSPILLGKRLARFESLAAEERVEILARLETAGSTLSLAFVGWRSLMTLVFYEDATELASFGYRDERRRHLALAPAQTATLLDPAGVPIPSESGVRLKFAEAQGPAEDRGHDSQDQNHDYDQAGDGNREQGAA